MKENSKGFRKLALRVITLLLAIVMLLPAFAHADWITNLEGDTKVNGVTKLHADYEVGAYQAPSYGRLSNVTPVKAGLGYLGGILLDKNGSVYTWGWNGQGQLGIAKDDGFVLPAGSDESYLNTYSYVKDHRPYSGGYTLVDFFTNPENYRGRNDELGRPIVDVPASPTKIVDIGAGYHHNVALDDQGRVWAWGYNIHNQIGLTEISRKTYPRLVKGLPTDVVKVFANAGELNGGLSIALTSTGEVWTWGAAYFGQHGAGVISADPLYQSVPHKAIFPAGTKIVDISAGMYHVLALDANGEIWMWGRSDYGAMAMGSYEDRYYHTPFKLTNKGGMVGKIKQISASYSGNLALDEANNVWQWGAVFQGGPSGTANGAVEYVNTPRKVEIGAGEAARVGYTPIAQGVFAGESVSYFVDQYGRPWAWGDNRYFGFGREGGYETNNNIISSKALQFPQVIGDGDTQIYDNQPRVPNFSQAELGVRLGNYGFNILHPTIYDKKYENSERDQRWLELALKPIPAIKQMYATRSSYLMLDNDGNLWRWSNDGSGTGAWGDGAYFDRSYDRTGNARDGLYDSYCYEVMFSNVGGIYQAPSYTVDKQVVSNVPADGVMVGDTITYQVKVTNTGSVAFDITGVEDSLVDNVTFDRTALAPGEVATATYTYTVAAADVVDGKVTNNVKVYANGDNDNPGEDGEEVVVKDPKTDYMVEKTVLSEIPASGAKVGDTIYYQIKITNTGNVALVITGVVDSLLDIGTPGRINLAPGQSVSATYGYTVAAADVVDGKVMNNVKVYVNDDNDNPSEDTVEVPVELAPEYIVAKTVKSMIPPTGVNIGDLVVYGIKVTNTGKVAFKITDVEDSLVDGVAFDPDAVVLPGQSASVTYMYYVDAQDVVDGKITNNVKVYVNDDQDNPGEDEVEVPVEAPKPDYSVEKRVASRVPAGGVKIGEVVTYQVRVMNTGNTTLEITKVEDSLVDAVLFDRSVLLPGQSAYATYNYTVAAADVVGGKVGNNIKVYVNNDEDNPVEDTEEVPVEAQNPAYTVEKRVASRIPAGGVKIGSVIVYQVRVMNTGNTTLEITKVEDTLADAVVFDRNTLLPGQSAYATYSYTVAAADVVGGVVRNNVKVYVNNDEDNPVEDNQEVPVEAQNSAYTVEKRAVSRIPATGAKVGEVIVYQVRVANTGNTTLEITNVEDSLVDVVLFDRTVLLPGQSTYATYYYTVVAADAVAGMVRNNVKVFMNNDVDNPVEDSEEVPVEAQQSGYTVEKRVASRIPAGGAKIGDVIAYQVRVANIGNTRLEITSVEDTLVDGVTFDSNVLLPGQVTYAIYYYTVAAEDVVDGKVSNNIKVYVNNDRDNPVEDGEEVPVESKPQYTVAKTVVEPLYLPGLTRIGDTVMYKVTVKNTGTVPVTISRADDTLYGGIQFNPSTLQPGEETSVTYPYVVKAADVVSNKLRNDVAVYAVNGDAPVGDYVVLDVARQIE